MKPVKYTRTPRRECRFCYWFNESASACSSPIADKLAQFNPNLDNPCFGLKWNKSETPVVKEPDFVTKFCKGTQCPYYYAKLNLCTRNSLCPYKNEELNLFNKLKFDNEV